MITTFLCYFSMYFLGLIFGILAGKRIAYKKVYSMFGKDPATIDVFVKSIQKKYGK